MDNFIPSFIINQFLLEQIIIMDVFFFSSKKEEITTKSPNHSMESHLFQAPKNPSKISNERKENES